MPDLLPQLGPQPAPAPNKPAPAPAGNRPVAQRSEPDRDSENQSFADAYDATESEEAPPPVQDRNPDAAETPDATPVAVAVIPATPGIFVTSETETPLVIPASTAVPIAEGDTAGTPVLKSAPNGGAATFPTVRSELQVQAATVAPETEGEVDLPKGAQRVAPVETVARPQAAPQTPLPQDLLNVPTTDAEADAAPEPELELPLPERVGPRQAATLVQQSSGQVPTPTQQPQVQTVSPSETGMAPLDEALPVGPQGTGASPIVSPTAPGTAPAQIAQHAAGQIVTALPRDQGVFITDAGAEIALDPPELGRVRMIVTEVAGGLALTVTAERPETLDLFRRHASMLASEFAREGFADTNFAFEGETENDGRNADTEDRPALRIAADPQDLINGITPQLTQGGGLDVRL